MNAAEKGHKLKKSRLKDWLDFRLSELAVSLMNLFQFSINPSKRQKKVIEALMVTTICSRPYPLEGAAYVF